MHGLQALDTALFHFINGSLGNPVFDWLMPRFSGHDVPWLPALVAVAAGMIFFGGARARICALLAVLVVALGDPLVIDTIKHLVARPRPCVALPDTVARLGCVDSGSMPSAHSANWFAATMVLFLFYRRSVWFMLPVAATVAFSRVYCGVHYPGDVLAGAILGAGYAVVLVLAAQQCWRTLGKRVFPAWYAHTPVLLEAGKNPAPAAEAGRDWLNLGYLLIGVTFVGHLIYLRSGLINLTEDEAYQWLWSKHLALSYYSKPPGIALIQWTGTHLWGDTELGVRFFSAVFAAILGLMLLRFLAREGDARSAFFTVLATLATPLLVAGSILMTIDPPLVLCWTWAVMAGWRAVQPAGKTGDWVCFGLAVGLGFLCKYTAAYVWVCLGLFLLLHRPARGQFKRPGLWLAVGIFTLCTLPVVIWNRQHKWIGMDNIASNAGAHSQWHPTLTYFWEFLGGEAGLLNPVFFVAAVWALGAAWRWRNERPLWLWLFCLSAPVFFGHWLYTFHSRVKLNWIAEAVPPMFCLMTLYWRERGPRVRPWLTTGLLLGIIMAVFLHSTDLFGRLVGQRLPGDMDPSHRARAWRQTAQMVEAARENFDPHAFVICDHYGITGLFTFYSPVAREAVLRGEPLVYFESSPTPENQFFFWDDYQYLRHRTGQNALYVSRLDPYKLPPGWFGRWFRHESPGQPIPRPTEPIDERIAAEFESVTNLGIHEVLLHDQVFQRVQIWGCYHLKPAA